MRLQRRLPALGQRLHAGGRDGHGAIPRRAQLLHGVGVAGAPSAAASASSSTTIASRSASLVCERDLVAVVVALEELVGGGAEARPDRLGLVAAHRPDGLPLGLQPLHLGGRGFPLGRLGQGLGADAQGFLRGEVVGPGLLAVGQVLAALARRTRCRPRGTAARDRDRLPVRRGPSSCQAFCSSWKRAAALRPVGRLGERFGFGDELRALLAAGRRVPAAAWRSTPRSGCG